MLTRSCWRSKLAYFLISILVLLWFGVLLKHQPERDSLLVGEAVREEQEQVETVGEKLLSLNSSDQHSVCLVSSCNSVEMATSAVVIWLHGLGDSGTANVGIKSLFTAQFMKNVKWLFPNAPVQRVTANYGAYMPSWFDVGELPISAQSPEMEAGVMKTVESVHAMINKEVEAGVSPDKIFLCGFSQGGALTLASALFYPETLAGAAVFSGWVPLNPEFISKIPAKAKQTPILWLHGMNDNIVDFKHGQAGPPLLEHAGVGCEFKAYPGLGHSISNEELSLLQEFFGRRLGASSSKE
ncbi:hypothetical protein R1sor_021060 [Riccia sorocarpa]|uniref:Phospholipase/carboxylesterase/thioesterase domain-containing protein n=1 Tax=Riccia sorocarpa TaxID=122646 RepID=A0ABD3GI31_9MARC